MTVKFAVPVLNETTVKITKTFGTTETSKTTKYCQILDQFCDCFDVRSLEKHKKKTKPFLKQYINENDKRFSWMTNQFLSCPNTWRKKNTQNRPGDFTQNRSEMFVSLQTYHGI